MSFQAQPQQQPQMPVQVYPNPVSDEPASGHSKGSFGTVFIVLAVIVVISAIACFLGRFCNKRYNKSYSHGHSQKPVKQQKQVHNVRFKDFEDIEVGFDKRMPTAKPHANANGNGNGHGHGRGYGYGGGRGPRPPPANGDMHKGFEMKVGGDGELRTSA